MANGSGGVNVVSREPNHDDDIGATPLSRSYADQIRSTMSQLSNRPFRWTRKGDPSEDVIRAQTQGEYLDQLGREAKHAVVVNPSHPLARFTAIAYPRRFARLERDPREWEFVISNRRSPTQGQPDLYKQGASGASWRPGDYMREGKPAPGGIALREDVWKVARGDRSPWTKKSTEHAKTTLAHELTHAEGRGGYPASRTIGERLQELLRRSGQGKFAKQYEEAGYSPAVAAREGLTEAAAHSATKYAVRSGRWKAAQKAVKESK